VRLGVFDHGVGSIEHNTFDINGAIVTPRLNLIPSNIGTLKRCSGPKAVQRIRVKSDAYPKSASFALESSALSSSAERFRLSRRKIAALAYVG
jgi:hypothetical protein